MIPKLDEPVPCTTCGTLTDHLDLLCGSCLTILVTEERAAQGLPPKITDPAALADIARVFRPEPLRSAS